MANQFFEQQFILDTPGATLLKVLMGSGIPPFIRVKGLRWVGSGAATDTCVIQADNGLTYWEAIAGAAQYNVTDRIERMWQRDFSLSTLTSGRVYIYLADKWG